jgi:hypothetical protein
MAKPRFAGFSIPSRHTPTPAASASAARRRAAWLPAPRGMAALLILGLALAACGPAATPTPGPMPIPSLTPTPTVEPTAIPRLTSTVTIEPTALHLEEHKLSAAPQADPFAFQPVDGTQDSMLAIHGAQRADRYPNAQTTLHDNPALSSIGDDTGLTAELVTASGNPPQQTALVWRGDRQIFSTDAGLPSPVMPLQGLWTYGGHWALEILYSTPDVWAGQVFIDGKLINKANNYDEAFSFQLLDGKPFFFYMRGGQAGYWYDGGDTNLGYSQIPHYNCCAESTLNPVQARQMVAFFAQRGQTWYYDELGVFSTP